MNKEYVFWSYFSYTGVLEVCMKRNIIFAVASLGIGIILALSVYLYDYFYPQQYIKTESGKYVNIAVVNNPETFPVTKDTQFTIEHFYMDEQRTLTENAGNIPILIGCNKQELKEYLNEYMKHLSADEKAEGLSSYEMVSYVNNTITLRKTYQIPSYEGYYAKSFNGTIVILKGDGKTVYEYTQISVSTLPEELKKQVQNGFFLEDDNSLYNFLETYSS